MLSFDIVSQAPCFGQLWGNASSLYIPYIRPTANTQACDIYGPICQTGTIVVGVDLGSTAGTMTASCSNYLQAQACSVNPPGINNNLGPFATAWMSNFGRSPECTAFAQAAGLMKQAGFTRSVRTASLIGQCNNASKTLLPIVNYAPWGVFNAQESAETYVCCGPCVLAVNQIRLAYFPENSPGSCSNHASGVVTSSASLPLSSGVARRQVTNGSTLIVDGFTLYGTPIG